MKREKAKTISEVLNLKNEEDEGKFVELAVKAKERIEELQSIKKYFGDGDIVEASASVTTDPATAAAIALTISQHYMAIDPDFLMQQIFQKLKRAMR